ncbi:MAG: thioredoxin domain-containing protein [Actinomycetota bacterium]
MSESAKRETGKEGGFRFSPRPNRSREINWLPWGEEAFERAAREGKPVLLSISAVWCHWCHVMDETTYSDDEVIELINSLYIPVRVDNDRHPDINRRYNQGGWPTTAFLSPRGALLAGTTYVPPETMRKVLRRISELYEENRERLVDTVPEIKMRGGGEGVLDTHLVEAVVSSLLAAWDREYGGLGQEPKFPHPDALFLALHSSLRGRREFLEFALHYLRAMSRGALRDPVEGGFFRYSVTRDWSVPHYEKMLDDNARLLVAYLRAYGATGEDEFLAVAGETASYIHRNLSDGDRLFFGSQDADEEYYRLDAAARKGRDAPPVDRTVYLDASSRAAAALLAAAAVLGRDDYSRLSLRFLDFALRNCLHPRGGMFHYHDGSSHRPGLLGDQVEMAISLQEAFSFTGDRTYLERSAELLRLVKEGLVDRESGLLLDLMKGFSPPGLSPMPADLASVSRASEAMLRQAYLAGEGQWKETAQNLLSSAVGDALSHGYFASPFALALDLLLEGPLVVRWRGGNKGLGRFLYAACALSPDHRSMLLPPSSEEGEGIGASVELCGETACLIRTGEVEEISAYLGIRPEIIEKIEQKAG